MKSMKKVLAFFMAMCMMFEMAFPTSAVEMTSTDTETAAEAVLEDTAEEEKGMLETEPLQEETSDETENMSETAVTAEVKAAVKPADGTSEGQPFPTNIGVGHYRIPAIQTLADGTLVASADARWGAWQNPDDCANIDSIVSRSADNGTTWNYTFANYIADNSNARDINAATFIDPSLATDGTTLYMVTDLFPGQNESKNCSVAAQTGTGFDANGNLLLKENANASSFDYYLKDGAIYNVSNESQVSGYSVDAYFNLSKDGKVLGNLFTYSTEYYQPLMTSYLYFTKSIDGGETWSEPHLLNIKNSNENYYLVSPGRGLITTDSTIIYPCYTKLNGNEFCASLLYSADQGATWKRSESATFDTSEGDIVQLNDGTLRYFYRHNTKNTNQLQYVDITGSAKDGYKFGSAVTVSGVSSYSGCNLSAITYSKTVDGKQVILVSSPTNSRTAGKIFTFTVEADNTLKLAATYDVNGATAYSYSSMTEQKDGSIGLLYEKGDSGNITYTNLAMDKIALGVTFDTENSDGSNQPESGENNGSGEMDGSNEENNSNGFNGTLNNDEVTEEVNVELYVNEEKTFTIDGHNYKDNVGEYDTRYAEVTVIGNDVAASKTTVPVTEIESGKSYLIVNSSTDTLLTDENESSGRYNGLKLKGGLSADSQELWKITKNNNSYVIQNSEGKYLAISNRSSNLSNTSSNITMNYINGYWNISQNSYYLYAYNGAIATGGGNTSARQWLIYEIQETEASSSTSVTIKGVAEGQTSVTVGHVQYNITVKPIPDYVDIETTPFLGGKGQGEGQKLTGLVITEGTEYQINLADGKTATSWTSTDPSIATVTNGKVTGVKAGETTITAVIDGVAYTIPVTVLPGPTTTSKRIIDAYSAHVTNCTPYYSINSGDLVEFKEGTQIYTEYNSDATRLITFFATPKEGYALTLVGDKGGEFYHSVRNEAGTGYGYDGTHNDGNITRPSDGKGYPYLHDHMIVYVVNNSGSLAATADQVHDMLDRAVALKCDGAYFYSKGVGDDGSYNARNIESYAAFIAEPLPTVTKKVSKVNGETYVEGETKINVGDTITFDVDVTQYAPEGDYTKVQNANNPATADITYTNASLNDKLENATFKNGTSTTIPELSNTAVEKNTTKTYEVTYKVTKDDLDTKIVNTVDLTYSYQSKHSRGTSKRSANAEASVSVLTGIPDDIVIDFGLPVTVDCSDITSYNFKEGEATFGIVAVSGKTATYTPDKVLTDVDTVTLTNEKGAEYKFKVYPATTMYYEETFATNVSGFTPEGTVVSSQQQTEVPGAGIFNYGYDTKYADEQAGASAGTQLTSTSLGDSAEFAFTGTGVDVYANTSETTGTVSIKVKKDGALKKLISVDTSMKAGTSASTAGQAVNAYNVPIACIDMKEAGNYTLTISHVKNKNADSTNTVNLDGFRVYNTVRNEEVNAVYKKDNEADPTYTELRNHVLSALNVEVDQSQYANQIAGTLYSQIYASGDVEAGAVIIDSVGNPYTNGDAQDLLDNGPKNELYLYPSQTITFKLNAAAQIGLKALDKSVSYTLNGTAADLTSSTDMFYPVAAGTVTIKNTGSTGILSITKIKAVSGTEAVSVLAELTEADLMPALLSLGYEAEKPMADAVAQMNLVDYTGAVLSETSLVINGEEGTDAVFSAEAVSAAANEVLPEGYAFVDESAFAEQTVKCGETAEITVQIGKVATLQVTYKKLLGGIAGTATLTGVQTSEKAYHSFNSTEILNAMPEGCWTIKLWGTNVKYGSTSNLTVNVF